MNSVFIPLAIIAIAGIIIIPTFAQQFVEPDYVITGGEVLGFEIDTENTSLIISLKSRASGELIITLPRSLIDAKIGSEYIDYVVLIDNLEFYFIEETSTSSSRTVTIPFERFNSEIKIIGTQVFSQEASSPTISPQQQIENKIRTELQSEIPKGNAKLLIFSDTRWSGALQASGFDFTTRNGKDDRTIIFACESSFFEEGVYAAKFQKMTKEGYLKIVAIQNQRILKVSSTQLPFGETDSDESECAICNYLMVKMPEAKITEDWMEFGGKSFQEVSIFGTCAEESALFGGGCLIATAAFGSELAPQVQELREIRDNRILKTRLGTAFMTGFNQFYYSFSPTIADWERQNPVFKEAVKLAITPLLTSLSILNYVDIDSEFEVLTYGISLILLNAGMYFVAPAVVIYKIRKFL